MAAALRAFKKIYLTVTHELIDRLKTRESANSRIFWMTTVVALVSLSTTDYIVYIRD